MIWSTDLPRYWLQELIRNVPRKLTIYSMNESQIYNCARSTILQSIIVEIQADPPFADCERYLESYLHYFVPIITNRKLTRNISDRFSIWKYFSTHRASSSFPHNSFLNPNLTMCEGFLKPDMSQVSLKPFDTNVYRNFCEWIIECD